MDTNDARWRRQSIDGRYIQKLLTELTRGQSQARNGITSDLLTISDNWSLIDWPCEFCNPNTVVEGSTNLLIISSEW